MRQKIVGLYGLGSESVQLALRDGTGGDFNSAPAPGRVARINIGADPKEWQEVVSSLLHEAMELAMARMKCRYLPADDCGGDALGYLFILPHTDFSDACGRVADLVAGALPDLAKSWKAWR